MFYFYLKLKELFGHPNILRKQWYMPWTIVMIIKIVYIKLLVCNIHKVYANYNCFILIIIISLLPYYANNKVKWYGLHN